MEEKAAERTAAKERTRLTQKEWKGVKERLISLADQIQNSRTAAMRRSPAAKARK